MSISTIRYTLINWAQLTRFAAVAIAGHRYWLFLILVPVVWLVPQTILVQIGWLEAIRPEGAQVRLFGLPLAVMGIYLGLRIIASEISGRTLEIVYTVPGGAKKVWLIKLAAAGMIMVATEIILAVYSWFLLTKFPLESLYGALQIGVFYMVLSMGFSALFRSEVAGAILAVAALGLNLVFTGFGEIQTRWTPLFNPYAVSSGRGFETVMAWTVQNRVGFALLILGLGSLAFLRGNRRERLLAA